MKLLISILLSSYLVLGFNNSEPRIDLVLKVEGIKTIEGKISISVFNSEAGFPEESNRAILKREIEVSSTEMLVNLGKLVPGNYAIALIQDVNSNDLLDKNFVGIPSEPFGFSNVNRFPLGAPSFSDAEIILNQESGLTVIKLLEL